MIGYDKLIPIHAASIITISKSGWFQDTILYDYVDQNCLHPNKKNANYMTYLQHENNYQQEIDVYWSNLQTFLDEETNIINETKVKLNIIDCDIFFHDSAHPYVQWTVEFKGIFHPGINIYENFVEPEILEYPINSKYILESPMEFSEIKSSLSYELQSHNRVVSFSGDKGKKLDAHERLKFRI